MRDNLVIVGLTIVSTWLLIDGYNDGDAGGLAQMGVGALIASLVLRLVFDTYGAAGPDADRPSEFSDGLYVDPRQSLTSLDSKRSRS